jgi:hypothetical protein
MLSAAAKRSNGLSNWIKLLQMHIRLQFTLLLLTSLGQVRFAVPGIHEVIDRALESVTSKSRAQQISSTAAEQVPSTAAEQAPSTAAEQAPSTAAEQALSTAAEQAPSTAAEQAAECSATISRATSELVIITGVSAEVLPCPLFQ